MPPSPCVCAACLARFAFEAVLIDWLNATHPDKLSDRCAHCGKRERPDAVLLPIGVGIRHTWLHRNCWVAWRIQRRARLKTISPAWAL
jgi:hypothetical protein